MVRTLHIEIQDTGCAHDLLYVLLLKPVGQNFSLLEKKCN